MKKKNIKKTSSLQYWISSSKWLPVLFFASLLFHLLKYLLVDSTPLYGTQHEDEHHDNASMHQHGEKRTPVD